MNGKIKKEENQLKPPSRNINYINRAENKTARESPRPSQCQENMRFISSSKPSRPALGPTQLLVQRVPEFVAEVQRPKLKLLTPPTITECKDEWSYASAPNTCLKGMEKDKPSFNFLTTRLF